MLGPRFRVLVLELGLRLRLGLDMTGFSFTLAENALV